MNHTSPKLPIHAGFPHYVKLVNTTAYGHYQNAREIIHTAGGHKKGPAPDNGTKGK